MEKIIYVSIPITVLYIIARRPKFSFCTELFGGQEEGIPATFQIINFIGWKPDASQVSAACVQ